jgi:hypothetical protein
LVVGYEGDKVPEVNSKLAAWAKKMNIPVTLLQKKPVNGTLHILLLSPI